MAKVLITGGSGLVGSQLSDLFQAKGYEVAHLSRRATGQERYRTYTWDVAAGKMDSQALEHVDYLVHLAGAGVADKRWTAARKQEILDSRTKSTDLLLETAHRSGAVLKSVVSASAIGYYGDTGRDWVTEISPAGSDFLATVVQAWEAHVDALAELAPVAKIRIGVVLSRHGGALQELAKPVKWWAGAPLGSGQQYMSWIHEQDLSRMFLFAMENQLNGVLNGVAPNPVTNAELTQVIARVLGKPLLLPNVPAFAMRALMGEMADIVLLGSRVSAEAVLKSGFTFEFNEVRQAVSDLLGK